MHESIPKISYWKEHEMSNKKTVVIISGSGIVTSTFVAVEVDALCEQHKIPVQIIQGKAVEAQPMLRAADLVVTTTRKLELNTPAPIISGVPFLNGIGEEALEASILRCLSN